MTAQQIILLVINVFGGVAVICSYILGLGAQAGGANALWGGVSPGIRPVYGISMILSALGYFAFLYYIMFKLAITEVTVAGISGFCLFYVIFIFMLIPSAFWMPLTNMYVASPAPGLWIAIRTVLILVGLASIALVWALLSLQTKVPGIAYWLAVAGSSYFAFHTFILDAILWPALFK